MRTERAYEYGLVAARPITLQILSTVAGSESGDYVP